MGKKIFIIIFGITILFLQNDCMSNQFDFVYDIDWNPDSWLPIINEDLGWNTDFWGIINENIVEGSESDLNQIIWIYHSDTEILDSNKKNKAVIYTRIIVNYFLTLVWFVALIILIYWFYMMFGNSHEEGVKKAKKYITWSVIAIFLIWVSRFIITWFMSIFLQAS